MIASGPMSKGAQLAVGATLIFGLLGWYGYTNLESASTFQYYKNLDEFLALAKSSEELAGKSLRVHGYVAPGTIERNLPAKNVTFEVQNEPPHKSGADARTLSVVFQGLETPDLFQDGADVVVEGTLGQNARGPVFIADNLLAKCPSKFQANPEAEAGAKAQGTTSL
jgi:cytochrome c-type biogenesis protein CcmE